MKNKLAAISYFIIFSLSLAFRCYFLSVEKITVTENQEWREITSVYENKSQIDLYYQPEVKNAKSCSVIFNFSNGIIFQSSYLNFSAIRKYFFSDFLDFSHIIFNKFLKNLIRIQTFF